MRDILIDGVPILDLLEITGSTSRVAALSNCDQSSVSRLYRHASDQLGLDFRKTEGHYRAHANQAVLRSLRHTAQLLRLTRSSRGLQWLGHPCSPLPQEWLAEERSLELLRERVLDLAVLADPDGLAPTWSDHSQPFPFGDWVVVGLTRARQPLRPAAVVLRHDNLEHPALQELIGQLRSDVLRTDVLRTDHQPFARVDALDVCHDLPPAPGHSDRGDAGTGQCRPQPQPGLAPGAARSAGGPAQPA
ncbi:hypothetical protein KBY57_10735 [Cyanobium sp. Aljojuca 7D2]|uniref:hypothetical protein n=1 Tax=Cyanobium sp. Aljojuca 7D2 TaxID=2823698 RepID=UPI0020CECA76|nr:hypothetical protein [Cyanobium sp. Aljojuca 7D2]MCP9891527.1 hypothetical protein [Cyanobium sp. Aljojuca 7D2]